MIYAEVDMVRGQNHEKSEWLGKPAPTASGRGFEFFEGVRCFIAWLHVSLNIVFIFAKRFNVGASMRILVTGFEPFGGEVSNPSWEVVHRVGATSLDGMVIITRRLPCVFGAAQQTLIRAIEDEEPDAVVCFGLAGDRAEISVERVAINVVDASIPDNRGQQPIDEPVVIGGPAAYFSSLPVKAIVKALEERGIRASVSQSAGTYVCNAVFYELLNFLSQCRRSTHAGFVHVPLLANENGLHAASSGMRLLDMVEGVRTILRVVASVRCDARRVRGTE